LKEDDNDYYIRDRNDDKIIIKKEEIQDKNALIIENINNCEIYILFNFKACYIKNIINSKIFIGSISGGSHITNCNNCEFYLITHQLRIHNNLNTNYFIIVSANPIIENCFGLSFYPLKIKYQELEENIKVFI
jgi:hypothetical protein